MDQRFVVRWNPPYSNGYKDQPCNFLREAHEMIRWFKSIGVKAFVVRVSETEEIIAETEPANEKDE